MGLTKAQHMVAEEREELIRDAAPELYEALRFYRDQFGDRSTWPEGDVAALELAVAALLKADGLIVGELRVGRSPGT